MIIFLGQKIVSFSYYGDSNSDLVNQRKYFEGIETNLKLMPKYYPGFNFANVYIKLDSFNIEQYFIQAIETTNLSRLLFSGWVMRLYFDLEKSDPLHEKLCKLACHNPELDLCYIRNLPGLNFTIIIFNANFFPKSVTN